MSRIIYFLPLLIIFGLISCSQPKVYVPKSYKAKRTPKSDPTIDTTAPKLPDGTEKKKAQGPNEFERPYIEVWRAAIDSAISLKWPIAYSDHVEGTIRLQEAYVYRGGGKLRRKYVWPSKEALQTSNINDYLERVARYNRSVTDTVFTQENMIIKLVEKDGITTVTFDYKIRPYTFSGTIGYEIDSKGYIESWILERMRESLGEKPIAKN